MSSTVQEQKPLSVAIDGVNRLDSPTRDRLWWGDELRKRIPPHPKKRKPMTVCLAAICNHGTSIVAACDRMLTAGDINFEVPGLSSERRFAPLLKTLPIDDLAIAMTAGDAGFQADALTQIWPKIKELKTAGKTPSIRDMAYMYVDFCAEAKRRIGEDQYLKPLGLTTASFIANQKAMTDSVVKTIATQIVNLEVGDPIIFAGIDATGAHIFKADGNGVLCCDSIGFAAIGSGARHAESQFMIGEHTRFDSMEDAVLQAYIAKKRSEIAPGVGELTDLFIIVEKVTNFTDIDLARLDKIYRQFEADQKAAVQPAKKAMHEWFEEVQAAEAERLKRAEAQTIQDSSK
jgi:hypothetical protein